MAAIMRNDSSWLEKEILLAESLLETSNPGRKKQKAPG